MKPWQSALLCGGSVITVMFGILLFQFFTVFGWPRRRNAHLSELLRSGTFLGMVRGYLAPANPERGYIGRILGMFYFHSDDNTNRFTILPFSPLHREVKQVWTLIHTGRADELGCKVLK